MIRRVKRYVRRMDADTMRKNRREWRILRQLQSDLAHFEGPVGRLGREIDRLSKGRRGVAMRVGAVAWFETSIGRASILRSAANQLIDLGEYTHATTLIKVGRRLPRGAGPFHELSAIVASLGGEWTRARNDYQVSLPRDRKDRAAVAREWVHRQQGLIDLRDALVAVDGAPEVPASTRVSGLPEKLAPFVASLITTHDVENSAIILDAFARTQWNGGHVSAPTSVASEVRTISLPSFRNRIAGKSIALIANSPSLLDSGLGKIIDSYDLVMRFNSFVIDPEHTGARTDIHVTIHMHDFNWDVPVDTRIVLSGRQHLWAESIKKRVRPGAQKWLADSSLRWPAPRMGLIEGEYAKKMPTAGFNMMTLLNHLDVNPVIDLIGFDFYESGILRVAGALDIPLSPVHKPEVEKAWVMDNATHVKDRIISLRAPLEEHV